MLVSIEGCIGVGKTTLTQKLSNELKYNAFYEEFDNNPFLQDFYKEPQKYAFHVQTTFLFLQAKQFNKALTASPDDSFALSDFHSIKGKVFSNLVITDEVELDILNKIYDKLYSKQSIENNIIIYLFASPSTILERVKKRNDKYTDDISIGYLSSLIESYNNFFATYKGKVIKIDTTDIDFVEKSNDWLNIKEFILKSIQST